MDHPILIVCYRFSGGAYVNVLGRGMQRGDRDRQMLGNYGT